METKQVAVVVKYFPTVSETFIVNQINSLIDNGYKVTLFAYNKTEDISINENINKHGLLNKVHYFDKPSKSILIRYFYFIKWVLKHFINIRWVLLFRTLNVFKYGKDAYSLKLFFESQWFLFPYEFRIIHAHFGMNGNRIAYLKTMNIIPEAIKLITTFHGYDLVPNQLLEYKFRYRYLFEKADAFTVNTPYLKGLLQQTNANNKPVHILPVGLDTSFFKRTDTKRNNEYFDLVFCGKLFPLKGPDLSVKIVKKLHETGFPQVRLHMIGDGSMRQQIEREIEDFQLQDAVFLYGNQTQEVVKRIFSESDVFIMPGRQDLETGRAETQGLVIQEAQAMELPVVVSDVGGMKYGILPNISGFVVSENDIDGFASVIEKLILNSKLHKSTGKKGREVAKNYDNNILVEKLLTIYNTLD